MASMRVLDPGRVVSMGGGEPRLVGGGCASMYGPGSLAADSSPFPGHRVTRTGSLHSLSVTPRGPPAALASPCLTTRSDAPWAAGLRTPQLQPREVHVATAAFAEQGAGLAVHARPPSPLEVARPVAPMQAPVVGRPPSGARAAMPTTPPGAGATHPQAGAAIAAQNPCAHPLLTNAQLEAGLQRVRVEVQSYVASLSEAFAEQLTCLRQELLSQWPERATGTAEASPWAYDGDAGACGTAGGHWLPIDAGLPANMLGESDQPHWEADLYAERVSRCEKDAELHARVAREVGDLGCRLEVQRDALAAEVAAARRQFEDQHSTMLRRIDQERSDRTRELLEVQATLDSVWQQLKALAAKGAPQPSEEDGVANFFKYLGENGEAVRYKECVGDPEDINTLYEMVREALGDTIHIKQQIKNERDERARDVKALSEHTKQLTSQLAALQAQA